MKAAGVPVLEAPRRGRQRSTSRCSWKASAGGGGRGMRVVRRLEDLGGRIEKAEAEALSAFGDGTVFVEPRVERGRHVEVQIVGNGRGDVLVLGERDCSLQRATRRSSRSRRRRTSPEDVADALRTRPRARPGGDRLPRCRDGRVPSTTGVRALLLPRDEHPSPGRAPGDRAGHGVDLVEMQLAVAEGASLDGWAVAGEPMGHAIEVRLYAEDPRRTTSRRAAG